MIWLVPILVYDSLITFRYSVHVLARGGGTGLGSGVRLTPLPLAFHYFLVLACCIHSFYSNSFGDCSLPLYWIRFAKFSITDNKGRGGPVIADAVVYLRSDHAPSKNLRSDHAPQKFNQNQTVWSLWCHWILCGHKMCWINARAHPIHEVLSCHV